MWKTLQPAPFTFLGIPNTALPGVVCTLAVILAMDGLVLIASGGASTEKTP